jgi:small subunit ribosomal protein S9
VSTETPEVAETEAVVTDAELEENAPESYTTETAPSIVPVSNIEPGAATGRRKEAVARVRIVPGTGKWKINGRELENYFPNKVHQQIVKEPLVSLGLENSYDVFARMHGGGVSGQAGALRLGVARSLNQADEEHNRPTLKKAGFLTRDPRAIERKKYGLKKARKAPQYSKR